MVGLYHWHPYELEAWLSGIALGCGLGLSLGALWTRGRPARRWWLLIIDSRDVVIHNEAFWTRWGARRHGRAITSPPLNHYEVRKS